MIRLLTILPFLAFLALFVPKIEAQSVADYLNQATEMYDSDPDSSFQLCLLAENIQQKTNDSTYAASIAHTKAMYYILKTDYGNAANELNKSILISEERNDLESLSSAYSLKSIFYERIGESEKSHIYLLKAYQISKETGNVPAQVHRLLNLSLHYLRRVDLDSAYITLKNLDELKDNINGTSLYYYNQNWGNYYKLTQDYQKALIYEEKALQVAELFDMLDSKATIYKELAVTHLANDDVKKALEFANLSYSISDQNNLIYEKSEALEILIKIQEQEQNYKEAFKLNQELSTVEKAILNIEKLSETTEKENQLAIAQKELEGKLAVAEKEKIIAEKELSIQKSQLETAEVKSQNLVLFIVVGTAIILIIVTTWIYIKTKKLNVEIQEQKGIIEEKNDFLKDAYKNINDSIQYSKHIQNAMLPNENLFDSNTSDHFILFRPKDIVSGDFYWAEQVANTFYFSVVDCTGHGVPGAMVSIIGFNGLNRCLKELHLSKTGEILDQLSEFVEGILSTDKSNIKDGMDMALCALERKDNDVSTITFSGANNGIYVISNGELTEYKPNKQPIGHYENKTPFDSHQIELKKGDLIYLFSDGYADQFGGPKGKKMKYKAFKDELIKVANQTLEQQKTHLNTFFENWMGDHEQIDDVCVIGIRV